MAAGNTYTPISSQTLTGNTSTISLGSFSGYTDLRIVMSYFANGDGQDILQINGTGGALYEQMILNAFTTATSGSVAQFKAYNFSGQGFFYTYGGWTQSGTTTPGIIELYIPLYTNTDSYHYVFGTYGSGNANAGSGNITYEHDLWQGQWKSSAAITSLTISRSTNSYTSGTVVEVFGIKEA